MPDSAKEGEINIQLYFDYIYLLFGMGIVAMNYFLLKEEVLYRAKRVKLKLQRTLTKISMRNK